MGRISIGHIKMREAFKRVYSTKEYEIIDNYRPEWLINPETKKKLELDVVVLDRRCNNIVAAGEHHGRQHYEYVQHFHNDKSGFKKQIKLDKIKKSILSKKQILLVEANKHNINNLDDIIYNIKEKSKMNNEISGVTKAAQELLINSNGNMTIALKELSTLKDVVPADTIKEIGGEIIAQLFAQESTKTNDKKTQVKQQTNVSVKEVDKFYDFFNTKDLSVLKSKIGYFKLYDDKWNAFCEIHGFTHKTIKTNLQSLLPEVAEDRTGVNTFRWVLDEKTDRIHVLACSVSKAQKRYAYIVYSSEFPQYDKLLKQFKTGKVSLTCIKSLSAARGSKKV